MDLFIVVQQANNVLRGDYLGVAGNEAWHQSRKAANEMVT